MITQELFCGFCGGETEVYEVRCEWGGCETPLECDDLEACDTENCIDTDMICPKGCGIPV